MRPPFSPAYDSPVRAVVLDEAGSAELVEVSALEPRPEEIRVHVEVALTNGTPLRGALCGIDSTTGRRLVAPGATWPYAEEVLVPEADALPAPPNLTADVAALAGPLARCLEAAERAGLDRGQRVSITDSGAIGLMLAAAANDAGASAFLPADSGLGPHFGATLAADDSDLVLAVADDDAPQTRRAALAFLATGAHPWGELISHRIGLDELPQLLGDPPADLLIAAVYP
jgi:threonine dehydrogenase-like Zn-dependent dehydrogenase